MPNRLVSVNENNELPLEVQAALVGPVEAHFQSLTDDAETAAATATTKASDASASASTASSAAVTATAAAATAVAPTETTVTSLITSPSSVQTALDARYVSSAVKPKQAVVVGSSNALSGTWPATVSSALGLTNTWNFAVGGAAISNGGFNVQLTSAKDSTSFTNADINYVFIVDCSNDIRANNDAGNVVDVYTAAGTLLSNARSWFPNARIIVVPVIWPATPSTQVTGVPGGYQSVWNFALYKQVDNLRRRALEYQCEFVEDSWTWLTGHDEWMEGTPAGTGGVHPNSLGYTEVANWILKYLRGESTTSRTPWVSVPVTNAGFFESVLTGSSRPLRVKRDGWTVILDGTIVTKSAPGASLDSDWAIVPNGFRPTYAAEGQMRINGSATHYPIQIFPNGTVRVNLTAGVPGSTYTLFHATYDIG